jgi:tetratricopeptide (TPR) repeat protein
MIEHNLGTTLARLHDPTAAGHTRAEVRAYEQATALSPDDSDQRLGLASAINGLGQILISDHHLEEGLAEFRRGLAIRESVRKLKPGDGIAASGIARTWLRIAGTLAGPWQENLGYTAQATEACDKAIAIYDRLTAADGGNRKAKGDLATALVYSGAIRRNTPDSLPHLRRAAALLAELRKEDAKQVSYRIDSAMAHEYLGHALREAGDFTGAIAEYRLSLEARENPEVAARIVESEKGLAGLAAKGR